MVDTENHPPEQEKPEKKLQLDLSEAMPHGFDEDDDEIIELKDEVNIEPKETETETEIFEESKEPAKASELPAVEKIIDLDALEDDESDPENVIRLSEDLTFDEEDDDEIDILPVEKEPVIEADDHDDVVEITEFDDILSEDKNEMATLSEISETLDVEEDDEDEFLELIDMEEDEEDEEIEFEELEEEVIQFDESATDIEDVELEDFINDALDEEIKIGEDFKEDLTSTLSVDAGDELDMAEAASMEEDFDFSMDSSEISKKIDQLDTIFFNDAEAEAELDEDAEIEEETAEPDEETVELPETVFEDIEDEIETEDIGVSGNESVDVPLAVGGIAAMDANHAQLEKTLEQIIERKFSGKIETLITQIIEKAVSKEIQRLKKILLEDDGDEDL
jgi:pilus assembly protein FimV